jgi:hypothetical protein
MNFFCDIAIKIILRTIGLFALGLLPIMFIPWFIFTGRWYHEDVYDLLVLI